MTTDPNYFHVYGHMDDYLDDSQPSFEQQMNKRCNILAKEAVGLAVKLTRLGHLRKQPQLLPKSQAAAQQSHARFETRERSFQASRKCACGCVSDPVRRAREVRLRARK